VNEMDKIMMKNLSFYGYHGVLKEENRLGQKFFVDIEILCDLTKASQTDEVEDTVNYGEVYQLTKEIVEQKTFKLIEALAQAIASEILTNFVKVNEVMVSIRKPEAPIHGIFDYFGVEIRRNRDV